jgi:hypothetical protein
LSLKSLFCCDLWVLHPHAIVRRHDQDHTPASSGLIGGVRSAPPEVLDHPPLGALQRLIADAGAAEQLRDVQPAVGLLLLDQGYALIPRLRRQLALQQGMTGSR